MGKKKRRKTKRAAPTEEKRSLAADIFTGVIVWIITEALDRVLEKLFGW